MSFGSADIADLAQALREVAAAEIMPRFQALPPGAVRAKSGPLDLVTEADEAAERRITAWLLRRFPGCLVVGEEAASADPSLLRGLADAELSFVVDPIDGTSNYAAGVPLFGVMVAAIRRGEVIGACIVDPMTNEASLALRGQGAWRERGGVCHDLRVAAPVPLAQMTGAASWRYFRSPRRESVLAGLTRIAQVWDFRCAAQVYRMIAGGHCHFLLFNRLLPWDHAPGWLLHREAGGYAARLDGSDYTPTETGGGLICAPDRASWEALHAALMAQDQISPGQISQDQIAGA